MRLLVVLTTAWYSNSSSASIDTETTDTET
jgi:hypothetical protein